MVSVFKPIVTLWFPTLSSTMILSGSFLMCSWLSVPVPMPCPVFRERLCLEHLLAFDYVRISFSEEQRKMRGETGGRKISWDMVAMKETEGLSELHLVEGS